MKDVVKILGGKKEEPGIIYELKGIISVLLLLAFIVASPFAFNAVRGISNEKTTENTVSSSDSGENTCTAPETTAPSTENVTTTTQPVEELNSVTEKATETTTEQPVTVTTTRRETTTVRAETTKKHTSATEETKKVTTTRKPIVTTTEVTTSAITTNIETTEQITTKPTTTKPTTTIAPNVYICGGTRGGSTLQFTANGNVSNPSYIWSSSNNNVATVSNGTVTAVDEGTAIITVTMNGQCSASKTVKVGINWGSEYTTSTKESENALKKLVATRTEWKYYSVVCGSCGYYDYWGTGVRCNQIYSKGCGGSFTNWIYNWSTKDPNSLPFKTADHGVRSYIDGNNREWYWTTYAGFNANGTRTVYTYRQGSYYISSIS